MGKTTAATPARRRHRPRSEMRALLLDAATQVAFARSSADSNDRNLLADIRITDVLAEVNRDHDPDSGTRPMTTGAVYQIWPDQASFQRELLAHVMEQISKLGSEEVEKLAFEMVADGAPAGEIFRRICDVDFRSARESPGVFLALGLVAMAPAHTVNEAQQNANEQFIASYSRLFTVLLRYAGRKVRADRALEDLIWATEALHAGYLLRSRSHPDIPERSNEIGWTARATAYLGIVEAFTEPI